MNKESSQTSCLTELYSLIECAHQHKTLIGDPFINYETLEINGGGQ